MLPVAVHLLHHTVCSYEHGAEKIVSSSNIQQMSATQQ